MAEHGVYISCAQEDRRAAAIILSAIEKHGISCASTPSGEASEGLSQLTQTAIARSRVLIVIYSRHANGCIPLTREVEYAASHELFILSVRIEDAPLSKELEFYLSTHHWMNAVGVDPEHLISELITRVETLVARQSAQSTGSIQPSEQSGRTKRARNTTYLVALILLLAVSGVSIAVATLVMKRAREGRLAEIASPSIEVDWSSEGNEGTLVLPGGVTMAFVWCPPGTFLMGSPEDEGPRMSEEIQHQVTLTQGFWLGKYEVTKQQWNAVMSDKPNNVGSENTQPATPSWTESQKFVLKLAMAGLRVQFPTEAQWEYACRAGSTSAYYFGEEELQLTSHAWYSGNSESTHRVGTTTPNAWGLYDMLGNVPEWCLDAFGEYESNHATDPTGPMNREAWVCRGGGWYFDAPECRSAYRRGWFEASDNVERGKPGPVGLRLCLAKTPPAEFLDAPEDGDNPNITPRRSRITASWQTNNSEAILELRDGVKIAFVWCPPGAYTMGSEVAGEGDEPRHEVSLTNGFWMGKYEVTQEQWRAVMTGNPSLYTGEEWRPVETVSWNDSQRYIETLNTAGRGNFRLPSEAEWEYACRARKTINPYAKNFGDYAWYETNTSGRPEPVGLKKPNNGGLFDMQGNLWEWCQDWYGDYGSDYATNPTGPGNGSQRVVRGGRWSSEKKFCSATNRYSYFPDFRGNGVGFRLCRDE